MILPSMLHLGRSRDVKDGSRRHRVRALASVKLEQLEERVVLSHGGGFASTVHQSPAETRVLATTTAPRIEVPIAISGFDITNATLTPGTGGLQITGMATGTILGQAFTTGATGSLTAAAGSKHFPSASLTLDSIHLSLLGLNVDTGAMNFKVTAARASSMVKTLSSELSSMLAVSSGGTATTVTELNGLLNSAEVLNVLNRTLEHARPQFMAVTRAQSTSGPDLHLRLTQTHVRNSGVLTRLRGSARGSIPVEVASPTGGGMLGDLLNGVTGKSQAVLRRRAASALQKITSTRVPISTATLPGLLTSSSPSSSVAADPIVLTLSLNPIDLNLLGLEVKLYGQDTSSPVTVTVSAQPGSGQLLGNLLTGVAGLLNTQGISNALNTVLNNVVALVNQSTLSVNGQTGTTTTTSTTPVLDAFIAPVHLDLLGAIVNTSPIHLQILAHSGNGLLLGNIATNLANLLNSPTGNLVNNVESGLTNLLANLNQLFPTIAAAASPSPAAGSAGSFQIISLTVPPIDLNLLGLILQTSTIQVNATSQSGNGDLLGNLLFDLFNTAHISQTDLNTINADLNAVLAKLIGILNASTLTLSNGALSSLTPVLQELASPTLVNTSGGTVPPEPVLNLNIATNDGSPPVDVNLLGVVVTTSNVQVQLSAQPGAGQILGNLVYNTSHLLDGGLLSVIGILSALGL